MATTQLGPNTVSTVGGGAANGILVNNVTGTGPVTGAPAMSHVGPSLG
mgnify:CR=1 FL=1